MDVPSTVQVLDPAVVAQERKPTAETTLDAVPVGDLAYIVRITGDPAVKRRLIEMGLVRGERVRVQRVAPLGDPIGLRVKGYQLALRKSEARTVVVTVSRVAETGLAETGLAEAALRGAAVTGASDGSDSGGRRPSPEVPSSHAATDRTTI